MTVSPTASPAADLRVPNPVASARSQRVGCNGGHEEARETQEGRGSREAIAENRVQGRSRGGTRDTGELRWESRGSRNVWRVAGLREAAVCGQQQHLEAVKGSERPMKGSERSRKGSTRRCAGFLTRPPPALAVSLNVEAFAQPSATTD